MAIGTRQGDINSILITGGTGSFGRALTTRLLDGNLVDRVVVYSRDELKQAQMDAEFKSDERLRFFLGDVRDGVRLTTALRGIDAVVHAAALKRVDRSALDVLEFIDTNITGTRNVIAAAHTNEVLIVCCLSTDKAVEATTPYGATKYMAETLAVAGNVYGDTRSFAVRYGNVIGSRGSVLDIWRAQYEAGEPLTITDPRMTRFWLPLDDAVDLVLMGLERTGGGEVFVPKGVERSMVLDFMHANLGHTGSKWKATGKRAYEKIHECLVASEEVDRVRDGGDCYVLLPHPSVVRWSPGPWGQDKPAVDEGFEYRSNL